MNLVCELSRNVVFRDRRSRISDEVRYVVRNHHTPPAMHEMPWWVGLTIWPAMHGEIELVSHPSPFGREVLEKMGPEIFDEMARNGLRGLNRQGWAGPQISTPPATTGRSPWRSYGGNGRRER